MLAMAVGGLLLGVFMLPFSEMERRQRAAQSSEFRVQSLLEPGYRQTGWDSPTSRSQGVLTRPQSRQARHMHMQHTKRTTHTSTRALLAQTSELGPARGPLRRLPLGPGRYPGARHRPKSRGGTSVLKRRGRGNAQYVCPSIGEGRRAGATARAWLGAHRSSVAG